MDANELMIGDWVQVPSGDNPIFLKVLGICPFLSGEYYAYTNPIIDRQPLWMKILEPIPLTTEILEKNGFEKIEGCVTAEAYILDKGEWGEANIIIRRFDFNESFVICTPKDQTARISIGYVHELQHALRLAGIKKEIVL